MLVRTHVLQTVISELGMIGVSIPEKIRIVSMPEWNWSEPWGDWAIGLGGGGW